MQKRPSFRAFLSAAIAVVLAGLWPMLVSAAGFRLISAPDPGQAPPAGGNGDSRGGILTENGRYILFASTANNLVQAGPDKPLPGAFPAVLNAYLLDRASGTSALVSLNVRDATGGNGDSLPMGVSEDGRYVLFESVASDLVYGDTNNATDVFLRDMVSGITLLVSAATNGVPGNGASQHPAMSHDGRYVAFVSEANNLVAQDTNGIADVFVRDLLNGQTTLASVGATAAPQVVLVETMAEFPTISADGRFICFYSTATNLVPSVPGGGGIYVRDLVAGTTVCASAAARQYLWPTYPPLSAFTCSHPLLSEDAQYAVFLAWGIRSYAHGSQTGLLCRFSIPSGQLDRIATNLPPRGHFEEVRSFDATPDGRFVVFTAVSNSTPFGNCFLVQWDGLDGSKRSVSLDTSNRLAVARYGYPVVDRSGRFVAFLSSATNLVTNAIPGEFHIYLRDLQEGTTTLVDADADGTGSGLAPLTPPAISGDGQFVAFHCPDGNLVTNDSNHTYDLFLRDVQLGTTELVSRHDPALPARTGTGHSSFWNLAASADGRYLAFTSEADNLVPGDTNGCPDVFVRDSITERNILVSAATNGAPGHGSSREPSLSADGSFVAFSSSAEDLAPGDANNTFDVFLRHLPQATTVLLSVGTNGFSGNGSSHSPTLSADGTHLLFLSGATNLSGGNFASGRDNLFYCEPASHAIWPLTFYGCQSHAMSQDGHWVVLAGGIVNSMPLLYVWDTSSKACVYTNSLYGTTNVAITPDGNQIVFLQQTNLYALDWHANTTNFIGIYTGARPKLHFSSDGRFMVYATSASQSALDSNAVSDIYLYDFQTSSNTLISRSYSGIAPNAASDTPDISGDGRLAVYRSFATNIYWGDTNGAPDLFVFDRFSGQNLPFSTAAQSSGMTNGISITPMFLPDGHSVAFQTWAADLVAGGLYTGSQLVAVDVEPLTFILTIEPDASGRNAILRWPVVSGRTYRVQSKAALEGGSWQDLSGDISGSGTRAAFTNAISSSGQEFYRVTSF